MKLIFTLTLLCALTTAHAQDTELEKIYSKESCECVTQKGKENNLTQETLTECMTSVLAKNSKLVEQESMRQYGDTSYFSGYLLGAELNKKVMVSMVNDCDTYFHLFDTLRYVEIKMMNKDSVQNRLIALNQIPTSDTTSIKHLIDRARTAFYLQKYTMALVDIHDVLQRDSSNVSAITIKAWIYELNKEYDAALVWYDKVISKTNSLGLKIIYEIVKRKAREEKS